MKKTLDFNPQATEDRIIPSQSYLHSTEIGKMAFLGPKEKNKSGWSCRWKKLGEEKGRKEGLTPTTRAA